MFFWRNPASFLEKQCQTTSQRLCVVGMGVGPEERHPFKILPALFLLPIFIKGVEAGREHLCTSPTASTNFFVRQFFFDAFIQRHFFVGKSAGVLNQFIQ